MKAELIAFFAGIGLTAAVVFVMVVTWLNVTGASLSFSVPGTPLGDRYPQVGWFDPKPCHSWQCIWEDQTHWYGFGGEHWYKLRDLMGRRI